jgi:uncharacterized protein Yka (UPF0111/DUF47 family)
MFSLQKFFGKDPQFFSLLSAAAAESQTGAKCLRRILTDNGSELSLFELRQSRKRSRELFEQLSELIVVTFVTSLEKEDIEALSNSIYKILKPLEKFAERLSIASEIVKGVDFFAQTKMLEDATSLVVEIVDQVSKTGNLEVVRKLNDSLHRIETEADQLEISLLKELYGKKEDALRIILVKDLYDLLEKSIDRCRDVGNIVMHITLKNS